MRLTILALLATVAAPALAQTPPRPAISLETLKTVTQTLSSDAYEGRAPTTAGEEKTVATIIQRFKAAGLKPGNHGAWTQAVPMVEITATDMSPITFTVPGKPAQSLA